LILEVHKNLAFLTLLERASGAITPTRRRSHFHLGEGVWFDAEKFLR
jgi:hypothetical protein